MTKDNIYHIIIIILIVIIISLILFHIIHNKNNSIEKFQIIESVSPYKSFLPHNIPVTPELCTKWAGYGECATNCAIAGACPDQCAGRDLIDDFEIHKEKCKAQSIDGIHCNETQYPNKFKYMKAQCPGSCP